MSDTLTSPPSGATPTEPPDDWVPAEQRVLGFDKRTVLPGVFALIVWAVLVHVVPAINSAIDYDNPIVAGDVIDLGDGDLTFVPAVGWDRRDGVLVGEELATPVSFSGPTSALLAREGITFAVQTAPFDGDENELLDRVLEISDVLDDVLAEDVGDRVQFTSSQGQPGVLAPFQGFEEEGFIATYVFEVQPSGEGAEPQMRGVEVIARGGLDVDDALGEDVAAMLLSVSYEQSVDEEEDS